MQCKLCSQIFNFHLWPLELEIVCACCCWKFNYYGPNCVPFIRRFHFFYVRRSEVVSDKNLLLLKNPFLIMCSSIIMEISKIIASELMQKKIFPFSTA